MDIKTLISRIAVDTSKIPNNYDDFIKLLLPLRVEYKNHIEPFFQGVYLDKMGDYDINPEWGSLSQASLLKFIILRDTDDFYLVLLKIMKSMFAKKDSESAHLMYTFPIISLTGSSTEHIYKLLYNCKVDTQRAFTNENDYININHYNTITEWEYMNTPKWKTSHGVTKLSKLLTFNPTVSQDALKLTEDWNVNKNSHQPNMKRVLSVLDDDMQGNFLQYSWYYNNTLVAFAICSNLNKMRIAHIVVTCSQLESMRELFGSDYNNIRKYLGDFVAYELNRDAFENSMDAIYYFGAGDLQGLEDYKSKLYKNKIYYKKKAVCSTNHFNNSL